MVCLGKIHLNSLGYDGIPHQVHSTNHDDCYFWLEFFYNIESFKTMWFKGYVQCDLRALENIKWSFIHWKKIQNDHNIIGSHC